MNPLREGLLLLGRSRSRTLLLALLLAAAGFLLAQTVLVAVNSRLALGVWLRRMPVDVLLSESGEALDEAAWRGKIDELPTLDWGRRLSREQAAAEFADAFGRPLEELLGENPFPAALELTLKPGTDPAGIAADLAVLESWPEVDEAAYDAELSARVAARLSLLGLWLGGASLIGLLAAGLLLRRGLSSQLAAWAPEMRLLALAGAPPARLRSPVLMAAALLGAVPMLAVLLVLVLEGWVAALFGLPFRVPLALQLLPLWGALALPLLGWRGLVIRVRKACRE